jgi:predicted HicB family RNase H-like nuclease
MAASAWLTIGDRGYVRGLARTEDSSPKKERCCAGRCQSCPAFKAMRDTFTVRLPQDLAEWLDRAAQKTGMSRGAIIRMELERAGSR